MSADASARGQLAASWNQHCAPPWLTPECRTNNAPGELLGNGFAAPLATWLPSSQTSTPLPGALRMMIECVCRRSSDDVSTRMLPPENSISRSPAPRTPSACRIVVPPALSRVIGPASPCRQFGRDQTRYQVQALPEPEISRCEAEAEIGIEHLRQAIARLRQRVRWQHRVEPDAAAQLR